MKNIWILNHYASGMAFEKGGRHYAIAKYLKKRGYNPVVFCANSKHGIKEKFFDGNILSYKYIVEDISVPFIYVKTHTYNSNGIDRIRSMVDYYFNVQKVAKEYAVLNGCPDLIYASSVHPLALVAGIQLAKHFNVKCICEVRDLWPESIVAFGVASQNNFVVKGMYHLEKWIYTKADSIIFTMEGGRDYVVEKGWNIERGGPVDLNKINHINNGVDLEPFDYNKEHYSFHDVDLDNPNLFKIVYTGALRKANNLNLLLDIAKQLSNRRIKFLIWGNGDDAAVLQSRIEQENIKNVVLKGKIDKKYIPYVLSRVDLAILNYEMHSIWKYGGSQNKLFEYFASGIPVMTNIVMGYDLIDRYHCGFHVDYSNIDSTVSRLNEISMMDKNKYQQYCLHAREAAVDYDFKVLTDKLIAVMESVM